MQFYQLCLPAPRIAGLLPARVPSSVPEITVINPRESVLDRQRAIWAAQDAEIEAFLQGARQRLAAVYAEVVNDYTPRPGTRSSGRSPHEPSRSPAFHAL